MIAHSKTCAASRRLDKSCRGRGFTLVELLVVIFILMLLVGIMAPLVSNVIQYVTTQKSQAAINLLDVACRMYAADFSSAPPSGKTKTMDDYPLSYDAGSDLYGCQLLVEMLTGYAKDLSATTDSGDKAGPPDGKPCSIKSGTTTFAFNQDDGYDGLGFRVTPGSKGYGPYNGAEKVRTSTVEATTVAYNMVESEYNDLKYDIYAIRDRSKTPRPVFEDAFGQPILYYRCVRGSYDMGDNPHAIAELKVSSVNPQDGSEQIDTVIHEDLCDSPPPGYISAGGTKNPYYRNDYMLLSWGGDKKWYTSDERLACNSGDSDNDGRRDNYVYSSKKDDANNLYGK